jgi:hypothetical protein
LWRTERSKCWQCHSRRLLQSSIYRQINNLLLLVSYHFTRAKKKYLISRNLGANSSTQTEIPTFRRFFINKRTGEKILSSDTSVICHLHRFSVSFAVTLSSYLMYCYDEFSAYTRSTNVCRSTKKNKFLITLRTYNFLQRLYTLFSAASVVYR